MSESNFGLGTKCVQGGYRPKNGEPRVLPIAQSTTFAYDTAAAMGALFDLEADGTLRGTSFRPMGQDIRRHLSGAGQVILMAVTLGTETEVLIRRAQSVCMPDAMMLDALASAAVESVCDGLCRERDARRGC